jgi:hypothetical protein
MSIEHLAPLSDGATPRHDVAAAGERVTFDSEGETVVGLLFRAAFGAGPTPAVTILGPETFQKEQAPLQYAPRLCAIPEAARRHFAVVPTPEKQLHWDNQARHLEYYDQPAVIDGAVVSVVDWFARHLRPA